MTPATDPVIDVVPCAKVGTDLPPPDGHHLWIIHAVYGYQPVPDQPHYLVMDVGTLITATKPGCWHCERPYSAELADEPCLGWPDD